MNCVRKRSVLVLVAALLAAVPVASACTNASINGVYGILSSGLNGSLQSATSLNRIVVDGAGHATGSATKSLNGTIVTYPITGTYQISANCNGTATWTNQSGSTEHDNFYLDNANKGAFLTQTDANHVQSSVAVAQGSTIVCTDLGVKRSYSVQLTGSVVSVGQVATSGRLTLNGTGDVTGTVTESVNGTIHNALSVTGTYSINSDCTGTATITPSGQSPINLTLLVVNLDKEIMAIETDTNTIVSGTLQQ